LPVLSGICKKLVSNMIFDKNFILPINFLVLPWFRIKRLAAAG
jgi:hypothetical protein